MKTSTGIAFLTSLIAGLGFATQAVAQTHVYDWPDAEMPVLVQNDSGLIFISTEKKPWRAYSWKQHNAGKGFQPVYLVDLDQNGTPEIIGAGTPTFVLRANSDPMWILNKGCKQAILGDFVADNKLDLVCNDGTALKAYTHDGQFAWSMSPGKAIDVCRAGDHSGDLKVDLECKLRGSKNWVRIDASGKVLDEAVASPEIPEEGGVELNQIEPVSAESTSELSEKAPLSEAKLDGKVLAALVKDLNGDGKKETIAVTKSSIYVISEDGTEVGKFSASAKSYKRKPLARLKDVYANYFADNAAAGEAVKALQDPLSQCYASRVRADQFAGTGLLILKVDVDDKGKVKDVSTVHSDIGDKKIVDCAQAALKKGAYPAGESAERPGTVNLNIEYTFWDE